MKRRRCQQFTVLLRFLADKTRTRILIPTHQAQRFHRNIATKSPILTMRKYPGLGLDLRYIPQYGNDSSKFHPIGAHGSCRGAKSDLLPIRELAMMSIMDRLTDKEDWHKKIFNDEIVAKWRKEAMSIPDEQFNQLATRDKSQHWDEDGNLSLSDDPNLEPLQGIMTTTAFEFVS
jgi:Protein of unknown function (DUF4246)